ncbi:hypothetical protein EB118_02190 [bacterium]|nr:hypothetical protein [bacterium]NDC93921.1 hypothetical protein [bacterium]NDD83246.1 hypothetical protein [bacterium]NDG28898.1 hypothetical protein [bacterium]
MTLVVIALAIFGGIVFFSPDKIFDKTSKNHVIQNIFEHNKIIGLACIAIAVYLYGKKHDNDKNIDIDETTTTLPTTTTDVQTPVVPTTMSFPSSE